MTSEDKESCFKLVKWAKEKLTLKYEKSKVEVSDLCPKKNSPKMTDHIDSGLETVCAILGGVRHFSKNEARIACLYLLFIKIISYLIGREPLEDSVKL